MCVRACVFHVLRLFTVSHTQCFCASDADITSILTTGTRPANCLSGIEDINPFTYDASPQQVGACMCVMCANNIVLFSNRRITD